MRRAFCLLPLTLLFFHSGAAHGRQRPKGPADSVPPSVDGGGTYRGPGDTGFRDPRRLKRRPPVRGRDSGPDRAEVTPNGASVAAGPLPCTGAQFDVDPDLSTWQHWWRHNGAGYLDLKRRLHTNSPTSGSDTFFLGEGDKLATWDALAPTDRQRREQVLPALLEVLGSEQSPALHREALHALARVAGRTEDCAAPERSTPSPYALVIESFLDDDSLAIAETAALALGILGEDASVTTLSALATDTELGHRLVDERWVPLRVRACATYALGLIGRRSTNDDVRREIAESAMVTLNSPNFATRDLKVAAMTAFGMTPIPQEVRSGGGAALGAAPVYSRALTRRSQVRFLIDYFDPDQERRNRTRRHWLVRAHAATALGRLAGDAPEDLRKRALELLLEALGPHSRERAEVQQSCVLALGALADSKNAEARSTLQRMTLAGDPQARRFALIALAQAAARPGEGNDPFAELEDARDFLVGQLEHGETQVKPWAALALGVLGNELDTRSRFVGQEALEALRDSCARNRRPDEAGAHMLALGLLGDTESVPTLTDKLAFFMGSDGARRSAAVAIGLTGSQSAIGALRTALEGATFRPALAEGLGIGLRLCDDRHIVPELARGLRSAPGFGSQAPIALALGQVGDSRAIPDLVKTLQDRTTTDWGRAMVAAALGSICDKDPLPWTYHVAAGINYRASTSTLTTPEGLGVLDYL